MLAQEKKLLTEIVDKIPDKRHRKVVKKKVRNRTETGAVVDSDVLELRIVGRASLVHKIEHIAIALGATMVEEADVEVLPAEQVEQEFADNPVGTIMQGVRHREGITQVELSNMTGIPQRHISEMENGKRPIGKGNARKLASAMDVDYRIFL